MSGGGELQLRRLDADAGDFWAQVARLAEWEEASTGDVEDTVRGILGEVRRRGDAALLELTRRLDGWSPAGAEALELPPERCERALHALDGTVRDALEKAASRIRAFHERQLERSWRFTDEEGVTLGQQITPLERVGIYVPGGKAAYPSSVLMNALPARVAGVDEVIMVVPTPSGAVDEAVLGAARIADVDRVFAIGGAQAVAALAFGTESVPAVDKIVGPGNAYVAAAKRLVFGRVGIDMVAGPSEILVVCDGTTRPDWVALDLFSQAEHDEDARAVLVSPDATFLERVAAEMARRLPWMARAATIRASLERHGALVRVDDLEQAVAVANALAPEHLELSVAQPESLLPKVRNAGAIFLGPHASEALGDYCAGPNHVLPTGRTARFSSPLGVYDFQKRSSVIGCTPEAARRLGPIAVALARAEGLEAHGLAAGLREGANDDEPER